MTREIKFRAQNERGRFVYGDYLSQYKDGVTTHYIVEHPHERDAGREVMWKIDVATLGEFTGLKDKNGKDIYEGDIVVYYSRNDRGYIYRKGNTVHTIQWKSTTHYTGFNLGNPERIEVIGNIHTTPNLLTNGDK